MHMKIPPQAQPWEAGYPPGLSWRDPLPPANFIDSIPATAAARWPRRVAIDFYDTQITFRELHELAARAAKGLQQLGVEPGVNVGLHLPNSPHFVICFFGVLMAGGCVVNCNPMCGLGELTAQLADSAATVLITADWLAQYADLGTAAARAEGLVHIVTCSLNDFLSDTAAASLASRPATDLRCAVNRITFGTLINNEGAFLRPARGNPEDEVAVLQYTGGTTGEPKGAMLTHANFSAVLAISDRWTRAQRRAALKMMRRLPKGQLLRRLSGILLSRLLGRRPNMKILGILPLSHIFGLKTVMLAALVHGAELVLHLRFDPGRVLADIARKQVSYVFAVPAMFTALVNHPAFGGADFSSLLGFGSGGAPLPPSLRSQYQTLTSRTIGEGYALTETTGLGTVLPATTSAEQPGRVGFPAPRTLIEIVDLESGMQLLPVGSIGEICFTGPTVMKGYWRKPQETQEAFRGGRFHTGDVGYIDAAGYVTLTERKKDLILVGAHNVYPRSIERAIYAHPAVMEVTVIGIPSPTLGEVAKAFIALKPDHKPFALADLRDFLAHELATHELPMELEFRPSLPKTPVGKLSKKELMAEEAARRQQPLVHEARS